MALGNLASRFLVAIIAAPALIFLMYRPESVLIAGVVTVAAILAMREFFNMTLTEPGHKRAMLIMGAAAISIFYWMNPDALGVGDETGRLLLVTGPVLAMAVAVLGPAIYFLFRFRDVETSAANMAFSTMGIVYAGLLFMTVAMAKRDFGPHGGDAVLLVLTIAWFGDTAAYFAGRFFGNKKLYEAVSPKKTWAGAYGGVLGSLLAVALMKLIRWDALSWVDVAVLGIVGNVLGQVGDLAESLIKRARGIKDSGSLLPGHGGMLDRVDAVLFIAPFVYLYFMLRPVFFG